LSLCQKIARLVAEQGWNQETFARRAGLHRHTARQILTQPNKKLRNATVRRIADALGLPVHTLLDEPLPALLQRHRTAAVTDLAGQPALRAWLAAHPEKAKQFDAQQIQDLASLHGTGGPLTAEGVEHFIRLARRRRRLHEQVEAIAGTEYLELLETFVTLLYDKVRPFASSAGGPNT